MFTLVIILAPIFDTILALIWSMFHDLFMSNLDENRSNLLLLSHIMLIKSYHTYNVLCLTFRRNLQVLIERQTSGAISRPRQRSDRCPKEQNERKLEVRTTVLQWPKPRTGAWPPCMVVRVTVRWCTAGRASWHGRVSARASWPRDFLDVLKAVFLHS